MRNTTARATAAGATWFNLARHEEPADPPAGPPADPADPPADPATGDGDGKDYKAEAEKWKKQARDNEARAKANADKAKRLDALEESQKSDAEKLTAAREAAEKRAVTATARAVRAEVKAAAGDFADPTDAEALLGDLTKYAGDDGEIDAEAIGKDLADLLERKPHLKKTAPRTGPRPDPSQGGGRDPGPTDFRKADSAALAKELAGYGLRPQSHS